MVQVFLKNNLKTSFSYVVSNTVDIKEGQIVRVPFRSRSVLGFVDSFKDLKFKGCKPLQEIYEVYPFVLPLNVRLFLKWMASYTFFPIGRLVGLFIPQGVEKKGRKVLNTKIQVMSLPPLNEDQKGVFEAIKECIGTYRVFLLDGVTGSGKTEVYFHLIQEVLNKGSQVLFLIPEVGLTLQMIQRFEERFKNTPLVWHHQTRASERKAIWQLCLTSIPCVVIGARSALFLPFSGLGLIIVDEEHDASYKQSESPTYHARDMAVVRASIEGIPIVLGSATPSLETFHNATELKRYTHLRLKSRYGVNLPHIRIVDRRFQKSREGSLSQEALRSIQEGLISGEQTLIYMNRRGFAPLQMCHVCSHRMVCNRCSISLSYHKFPQKRLLCHHCGACQGIPLSCPACAEETDWVSLGLGVEKVLQDVESFFPTARARIISSDEIQSLKEREVLLKTIDNQEVDILIATQILAKGYDFPHLTRVIIADADSGMMGCDLRGCEKTYQMLSQVAGRSGRSSQQGIVLIQTRDPENPVIQAIKSQDRDSFYRSELEDRRLHEMPPFMRMVSIVFSSTNESKLCSIVRGMVPITILKGVTSVGPFPCPLYKKQGRYRYRLLFKARSHAELLQEVPKWLLSRKIPSSIRVHVDMDVRDFY